MNNPNLTQSILHRVVDEKLKPKPRWQFVIKHALIWLGVLLSIIIGSLASSVLAFLVINNDWEAYDLITKNLLNFILLTLPYFWLFIFIVFIALAFFYTRHTKHGYRYSLWRLALIYLIACSVIGGTVYAYGGSQEIDRLLTVNVPVYKNIVNQQTNRWAQPKAGLISGDIESLDPQKKELILEDNQGNLWHVNYSDAKLDNKAKLNRGEALRLIGDEDQKNKDYFTAKKILPTKPTLHREKHKKDNEINEKFNKEKQERTTENKEKNKDNEQKDDN